MRWFLPLLVIVGLAWLALCCVKHHAHAIEADISLRAAQVAIQSPWAQVSVEGRDITVDGAPPTQTAARVVLDQLADVHGVRHVRATWSSGDAPSTGDASSLQSTTPLTLSATVRHSTPGEPAINLHGTLPTADDADNLHAYLRGHRSRPNIAAELRADNSASDRQSALFRQAVATGIRGLMQLTSAKLQVDEHQITLAGTTRSALSQRLVDADMRRNLPDGYTYRSLLSSQDRRAHIQVPSRPLTPVQQAVVTACQAGFDTLMRNSNIEFATNSDRLDATSGALLDRIAVQAKACQNTRVLIAGHSDNTGNAAYNIDLSQRRAEAVRQALIDRNIDAGRLQARGFGAMHPRTSNDSPSGRAANRRIEFTLTYATAETTP